MSGSTALSKYEPSFSESLDQRTKTQCECWESLKASKLVGNRLDFGKASSKTWRVKRKQKEETLDEYLQRKLQNTSNRKGKIMME